MIGALGSIEFLKYRVVHALCAERLFDGGEVGPVPVGSELHAVCEASGNVGHKEGGAHRVAGA